MINSTFSVHVDVVFLPNQMSAKCSATKPTVTKPETEFSLGYKTGDDGLSIQNLSKMDLESLSPLTGEVMSRQATVNIGTIGHVAHGKSTVVKALSTVRTVRFKSELERNITIKLGYANAKIYCAVNKSTPRPDCYKSFGSQTPDDYVDPKTKVRYHLRRHVSFVDCPGHDILMATMLNGAAVMDAALLLVAGNEPCPQPQVPIIRTLSLSVQQI